MSRATKIERGIIVINNDCILGNTILIKEAPYTMLESTYASYGNDLYQGKVRTFYRKTNPANKMGRIK